MQLFPPDIVTAMARLIVPDISLLGLPPGEDRTAAGYLVRNLHQLHDYTEQFEQAVRLADHAESSITPLEAREQDLERRAAADPGAIPLLNQNRDWMKLYHSWIEIAARDCAMTIDHFEHLRRRINELASKIPIIEALVDRAELKLAGDLFRAHFPNCELIRDAVAHASERASSRNEVERLSFSGVHSGPGVRLDGARHVTLTVQTGRVLQMTWKQKLVSVAVDEETLGKLLEVKLSVYRAFEPVQAALAGTDLGD